MLLAGKSYTLSVLEDLRVGLVLGVGGFEVLLPRREVPDDAKIGDKLDVFLFTDTEDRLSATLQQPKARLGEFACLRVVDVTEHGAFLDWGLDKDLFLPFGEMFTPVHLGQDVVVHLGLGARGRVVATSKLARHLDRDVRDVEVGQPVDLLVYSFTDHGVLVLVDKRWAGMIHSSEIHQRLSMGVNLRGWIKEVRPDGRLEVRLQPPGIAGVEASQQAVLRALDEEGGRLGLHDKSAPADIERRLRMSKKAFKRAVGSLYKAGQIRLVDCGIERVIDTSAPSDAPAPEGD